MAIRAGAWVGLVVLTVLRGAGGAAADSLVIYFSDQNLDAILRVQDLNDDGDVDLSDLGALLAAYGACSGDPRYIAAADFDGNGCVDLSDLGTLLAYYGS